LSRGGVRRARCSGRWPSCWRRGTRRRSSRPVLRVAGRLGEGKKSGRDGNPQLQRREHVISGLSHRSPSPFTTAPRRSSTIRLITSLTVSPRALASRRSHSIWGRVRITAERCIVDMARAYAIGVGRGRGKAPAGRVRPCARTSLNRHFGFC
jgi:hypothetical protein